MRPRDCEIAAASADFDPALAAMGADYWRARVNGCLDRGTHSALVSLYASAKHYPALVAALSEVEREAAAYDASEHGDWESDFDTY